VPVSLYDFFLAATAAAFISVAGVMGWGIVRRHSRGDEPTNPADRDSLGRELLWWALPTLLMLALFALTIVRATER